MTAAMNVFKRKMNFSDGFTQRTEAMIELKSILFSVVRDMTNSLYIL